MAPRTFVSANHQQWLLLAAEVRARREALGLTQNECVERSNKGISDSVWSVLEGARQANHQMEERSLQAASVALGWHATSAQSILAGHGPIEGHPDDEPPPTPPAVSIERRIEEMQSEMAEMKALLIAALGGQTGHLDADLAGAKDVLGGRPTGYDPDEDDPQ